MAKPDVKLMQDKLDLLMKENEQLRRKLQLVTGGQGHGTTLSMGTVASVTYSRSSGPQATIAGLSVSYLIVDSDFRVLRMNSAMAEFLGITKDRAAGKPPVSEFDTLEWAPGVFQTLLQDSLLHEDEEVFETERPNPLTGQTSYFQFKAVWSGRQGTVTVEDVTRLRVTRQFFERLVSPRIVEQLLDSNKDPFVSAKRLMTVMFGDLRSFTSFCEAVDGQTVQTVFNEFFDVCIQAIDRNEATLDKFVGDQVMALTGAPLPNPAHAYTAVKLAVDIQLGMQAARERWLARGLVPVHILQAHPEVLTLGVGINTGEMLLGMFGSDRCNQYTVLGHNVNLAERLCSFAAGNEVLATLSTVHAISRYARENPQAIEIPIKFRTKAQIEVKGIAEPVTVATLAYRQ